MSSNVDLFLKHSLVLEKVKSIFSKYGSGSSGSKWRFEETVAAVVVVEEVADWLSSAFNGSATVSTACSFCEAVVEVA